MVSINAQSSERTANPLVFAWRIVSIRLVFELQRLPIVDRVVARDSHCHDCLRGWAYQAFDENKVNQPSRSLLMDNYRMQFSPEDRLFVLSGAGISAESGLATFRGSGGLWNGHRVEEVATLEAWDADPELVWRFYSMRRRDALAARPNAAHLVLATVEQSLGGRFYLCTQNVDDLHERAGSERIHPFTWNALPIPLCSL
jgi:hypothetical protein